MQLLRKSSSWEISLQGQCHSLACRGLCKNCNSDLAFRGGLSPQPGLSQGPGCSDWLLEPPAKPKNQLGSKQCQNRGPAAPASLRPLDLVGSSGLRAPPNPGCLPGVHSHTANVLSAEWRRGLGIRAPPPLVPASGLLLASKASLLVLLHGSAPTRPVPGCKSLRAPRSGTAYGIALPAAPQAPSSAPALPRELALSSAHTHGKPTKQHSAACSLKGPWGADAMRSGVHPLTDLSAGTPSFWRTGPN